MATEIQHGNNTEEGTSGSPHTHTLGAMTAGTRLAVVIQLDGTVPDDLTGVTAITLEGVDLVRIGYRYRFPGVPFALTSLWISEVLTGGETELLVYSAATGYWYSTIHWVEAVDLDGTLDTENSFSNYAVGLAVGFTTNHDNSFGIGIGGDENTVGWQDFAGTNEAVFSEDLGTAGANTLTFTDLGADAARSGVVYALRSAGAGANGAARHYYAQSQ